MIALLRFLAFWLLFGFLVRLIRSVVGEFSRRPVVHQGDVRPKPMPISAEDVDFEEIKT